MRTYIFRNQILGIKFHYMPSFVYEKRSRMFRGCLYVFAYFAERNSVKVNQKQMERVTYRKWVGRMWRNRHGDTAFPRISFHMLGVIFLSVDRVRKHHRIVSLYGYLQFKSSTTHLRSFHTDCPFSTVRTPFPKPQDVHSFTHD